MRTLSKITLVLGISLVLATGCSSDDSSDDSTLLWLAALSQVQPATSCTSANFLAAVSGSAQAMTLTTNTTGGAGSFSGFAGAPGLLTSNTIRVSSTTTTLNTSAPLATVSAFRGTTCADTISANAAATALSCTKAANQINCTVNTAGNYVIVAGISAGSGAPATSAPTDFTIQKL